MKQFPKKLSKGSAGFTMIETLIAIAVLMLAVAGPLTLAAQGLISARFAKDQIVAFYLAQEAVEVIRNQRDINALHNREWNFGLQTCRSSVGCQVDATVSVGGESHEFERCDNTSGCDVLNRHDSTGFYSYESTSGYDPSRFTRTIKMQQVSDVESKADITIEWNNGPIDQSFTIQENFMDWQ